MIRHNNIASTPTAGVSISRSAPTGLDVNVRRDTITVRNSEIFRIDKTDGTPVISRITNPVGFDHMHTHRCNNGGRSCLACNYISESNIIRCYTTKLSFLPITNAATSCRSTRVIYLASCRICGLQYTGLTSRQFKTRILEHRNNIIKKKKGIF